MKKAEVKQIEKVRCVACYESVPSFEIVSLGSIDKGYRDLCSRCFNTEMAQLGGLNRFEHLDLKPVTVSDAAGKEHEFHLRTYLFGTGVALDAFEVRGGHPAGYQFQIIGEPEEDLLILLGKLVEKIRRGLSRKHLKRERYGVQGRRNRIGPSPGPNASACSFRIRHQTVLGAEMELFEALPWGRRAPSACLQQPAPALDGYFTEY